MTHPVRPSDPAIKAYHAALRTFAAHAAAHEGATETAFARLLTDTARPHGWTLIPKKGMKVGGKHIVPDGTLQDGNFLPRGYWEAKDTADDLNAEIGKKRKKGYPLTNTVFEDTRRAVLFQNGAAADEFDLTDPAAVADLLTRFYSFAEPDIEGFNRAVAEFQERVPELARGLADTIRKAHDDNPTFQAAFAKFFDLCQTALNPNIRREAVDEMLVQHLLTERLFRKIFHDDEFTRRNVIAAEVEAVIGALVSKSFSRDAFLKALDKFYKAIELAAETIDDFADKQHFLNTVYERFFQGYSVKAADTHGIVYTPQPIVDFMCASVEEVLKAEFGLTLGSKEVVILDPCTGTGNFVVNLIRRVPKMALPDLYANRLFANEVMLLPYYIAALNIEHAYGEQAGEYRPFEGLCFVDTLDIAEKAHRQDLPFFAEKNAERVNRQRDTKITIVIGNPPYNAHQINENDKNKNRTYNEIDRRIDETYVGDSTARLRSALDDAYVRFFRWASDRLKDRPGIVCFVTNNGFVDGKAFDGFRKHLLQDFDLVYHLNTLGDARTSGDERRRQGGNVFDDQIRVGVGVTILIRRTKPQPPTVRFHSLADNARSKAKLDAIKSFKSVAGVPWVMLSPTANYDWFPSANTVEFDSFIPVGSHDWKTGKKGAEGAVFQAYCSGVKTNADDYVYGWDRRKLAERAGAMVEDFNTQLDRWRRSGMPKDVDEFLTVNEKVHKWIRKTKKVLARGEHLSFDPVSIRRATYRPFVRQWYFFDRNFSEDVYWFPKFLPTADAENKVIVITDVASRAPIFSAFCTHDIPDLHLSASTDSHQCFPFYVYAADGSRQENVTDWVLKQFRTHYKDKKLTKWDIFHYAYGLLHHPGYRTKFADNLKKSLPRLPFAPDFRAFATAGRELAALHIGYETADPYPLGAEEAAGVPLSWRVEKMVLSKDKTRLKVNDTLTLTGLPPAAFGYRLGNRSALEWVIDQYRVTEDKRTGIRSDPNRADDPEFIVRLVGQVIRVSVETVRLVAGLPAEYAG